MKREKLQWNIKEKVIINTIHTIFFWVNINIRYIMKPDEAFTEQKEVENLKNLQYKQISSTLHSISPSLPIKLLPIGTLSLWILCFSAGAMEDQLRQFVEETSWYNDLVLGAVLPEKWWAPLPHFYRGWLRNYIGGTLLYMVSGILWCFYIYYLKRNVYLPKGHHLSLFLLFDEWGLAAFSRSDRVSAF